MSMQTYEKVNFDDQVSINSEHMNKNYKILLISQNSLDINLIGKLLKGFGSFKLYEARNIKSALKSVSYVTVDLVIVDDKLPTQRGIDIITKLNRSQLLKDVPKVMLLTEDYKESLYVHENYDNLDFIKKPIDSMIFKTRIHSILKNRQDQFMGNSDFENMIDSKINEAKEFLKIYKSFLDIDNNLLFVYDKSSNRVVESNKNFMKFFGGNMLFTKVVSNPRLLKRFVPSISDPNYLNNHHVETWLDLITSVSDFNFLVTIKNRSKEYTFSIIVNKMKLFKKDIYIVKLSNHILDSSSSKLAKFQKQKVDTCLLSLQKSLNTLKLDEKKVDIEHNIKALLDELKIPSSHFKRQSYHRSDEINIHFVLAKILKNRLGDIQATLNGTLIGKEFNLDEEILYVQIPPEPLIQVVTGILDSYHDTKNLKVSVKFYKLENKIKLEIITKNDACKDDSKTLVDRLLKKDGEDDFVNESRQEIVSKHVQNALQQMNADIKTYFNSEQNIFLISIP